MPIIFDGIPRNQEQSGTFEALLQKMNREYIGIYFDISRHEAEKRLIWRRICMDCKATYPFAYSHPVCEKCSGTLFRRTDDNPESIRTRIDIFYKETLPVIEEWKTREKMITVNGTGTIEEVSKNLFEKLG